MTLNLKEKSLQNNNQKVTTSTSAQSKPQDMFYVYRVRVMVVNGTFTNISVISWLSVLLVEETGVPGENH
jgi:hypothetical protein